MRRDPKQPRGEFGRRLVRTPRTVHSQKNFLRQFLGHRMILDHSVEEMNNGRAVLLQQEPKARTISLFNAEHWLSVVVQSRCGSSHTGLNPFWHPRLRSPGK